ncbi:MAG: hypothetical protein JXA54_12515 [Candidatus Heimdallarchaeota archaeon]|nr:hypothetical protein [Candidatus Heimdallarchaeota archaeon]
MSNLENFSKGFLADWIKILMESINENVDNETRQKIFAKTGSYCAQAHAKELFITIKNSTSDFNEFLVQINEKMKGTTWEQIDSNTLRVTYERCYCPMINFGLYKTPVQCNCSIGWLKENLEMVLDKKVNVKLDESVLNGGTKCFFTINY